MHDENFGVSKEGALLIFGVRVATIKFGERARPGIRREGTNKFCLVQQGTFRHDHKF